MKEQLQMDAAIPNCEEEYTDIVAEPINLWCQCKAGSSLSPDALNHGFVR